jgi:phage FluMu protein Com
MREKPPWRLDRGEGGFVSRVISCPHCQRKLALKTEFQGRRLACPKCKGTFTMPDEDSAPAEASSSPSGSGMDFLDSLSSGSSGKKAAANEPMLPSSPSRSTYTKTAGKRKAKGNPLLGVYIGVGVVAAVVVLGAIVALMSGGGPSQREDKIKDGLKLTERKKIFQDLYRAVDQNGPNEVCKQRWKQIAAEHKTNLEVIRRIIEDGMQEGWEQPGFENYNINAKTHRMDWIRERGLDGRNDPLLR